MEAIWEGVPKFDLLKEKGSKTNANFSDGE